MIIKLLQCLLFVCTVASVKAQAPKVLVPVPLVPGQPAQTGQSVTGQSIPGQSGIGQSLAGASIPGSASARIPTPAPTNTQDAFFAALQKGDKKGVSDALSRGASANATGADGISALHLALNGKEGKPMLGIIPLLITSGADVNAPDKEGYPPIFKAAYSTYADSLVQMLLAPKTLNPNVQDANGNTPLMILINRINQGENASHISHWANAARALIGADGTSLDIANNDGETALLLALSGTAFNSVGDALLARRPNLGVQDKNGETPLIKAVKNNTIGAIPPLLKDKGSNLDAQDKTGKTALAWALNIDSFAEKSKPCANVTVALLLNAGANNPDVVSQVFDAAQSKEGLQKLERLIGKGVSVNIKDSRGNTPLIVAAQAGIDSIVSYLLGVQDQYHVHKTPRLLDPTSLKGAVCYSSDILPFAEVDTVDVMIKNNSGVDAVTAATQRSTKSLIQDYIDNMTTA